MTSRIHSVVVVVSDQEAALAFYTGVLGWVKREDNQMTPDYRFLVVATRSHDRHLPRTRAHPRPGCPRHRLAT